MDRQKYRLLATPVSNKEVGPGTIVYPCKGYDYGCSSDDFHFTGYEHKPMTLSPDGDYPFFTVRVVDMEEVT